MSDKKQATSDKTSDKRLLPCPFCGGEARLQKPYRKRNWYVICKNLKCGCRTPFYQHRFVSEDDLKAVAVTTWNTRKPVDAVLYRLEEAKTKKFVSGITANPYEFGACHAMDTAIEIVKEMLTT